MKSISLLVPALLGLAGQSYASGTPSDRVETLSTDSAVWLDVGNDDPHHEALPAGSYRGKLNNRSSVDLLVKPLRGRSESYLAVMVQGNSKQSKIALYLIDPLESSQFVMTPLLVTEDGEVGVTNDDPSLVLNLGDIKHGKRTFVITNANSSNRAGFQGSMIFETDDSNLQWLDYQSAAYKLDGVRDTAALLSPIPPGERQSTALFTAGDRISGNFAIREKLPNIFTLKGFVVSSRGAQTENYPKKIGIFVKQIRFMARDKTRFLLINPANDTDVMNFEKK
jgi:hypothetical protein